VQPSNAESTGPRGGLYSGRRPQQHREEGGGDRLPLVFCFFSSHFLILVTPLLPLLHYFPLAYHRGHYWGWVWRAFITPD